MKYVFILGFIAILIAVFAYNSLFSVGEYSTSDDATTTEAVSDTATATDGPVTGTDTLQVLRERSADLECVIEYESAEGVVEGTLFTSDGELRGDFLVPTPDMTGEMVSSMILKDTEMLVWTDWEGEAQGVRVPADAIDQASGQAPVAQDESVTYRCEEWSPVDRSVFTVPGDVLLYDFGDVIQSGPEYGVIYEEE